jgi:hypothetical protein
MTIPDKSTKARLFAAAVSNSLPKKTLTYRSSSAEPLQGSLGLLYALCYSNQVFQVFEKHISGILQRLTAQRNGLP